MSTQMSYKFHKCDYLAWMPARTPPTTFFGREVQSGLDPYLIASVIKQIDSAFILKDQQKTAIKAFVDQKDVFAILPMGFSKSLIYQLALMITKKMGCNENHVVIVVSSLVTLMEDQVKEATLIILLLLPAYV